MSLDRGTLQKVVDEFWLARDHGVYFPPSWQDRLDLDDAYRIQLALVGRRCSADVAQIGWKIGLTAKAIQDQFKVHEPVFGCLLSEGRIESGHRFRHDELIMPGFESEICVVLGRDLTGANLGVEDVARAVDRCHPALEIIETRGDLTHQLALALADNAQQKFFVIGAPVRLTDALDLARIGARVTVNGAEVGAGLGDAVLGHPLRAVAWLAGKLADYDQHLKAGDHVMTGSFTRQFPIARGDHIRTDFESVGVVEAIFA